MPPSLLHPLAWLACAISATLPRAAAGTLYATDFEAFTPGDNHWAGTEGWLSNDTTSGAQGILADYVENLPLGRTAYLGYEPPAAAFTTVYRTVGYDPATGLVPVVEFDSYLGLQDSTNGQRDRFHISFYNIPGDFLAALCLDNTNGNVWREDGVGRADTGVAFIRGNQLLGLIALQVLHARIDLVQNHWSAWLDGIPLFTAAPFTATAAPRTIGPVAAEWSVATTTPELAPGNNWLFIADWAVRTAPVGGEPFRVTSVTRDASGRATITWPGEPGFDYQVWYSADLVLWLDDLPGSSFPGVAGFGALSFTDPSGSTARRFYRVSRSASP